MAGHIGVRCMHESPLLADLHGVRLFLKFRELCASFNKGSRVPTNMVECPIVSLLFEIIALNMI